MASRSPDDFAHRIAPIDREGSLSLDTLLTPPETPQRRLTQEEINTFLQDGVVHVKSLLDARWLSKLAAAVAPLSAPELAKSSLQQQSAQAWLKDPKLAEVVHSCPVAHTAQQVLDALSPEKEGANKRVRFFYDQAFVKFALTPERAAAAAAAESRFRQDGDGSPVGNTPWHQDITFWPVSGEEIVSIWIPLDRTDLQNGGLEFVRGSHAWGRKFKANGVGITFPSGDALEDVPIVPSATNGDNPADYDPRVVSFACEPGDALVFSPQVLHGAPPVASPERGRRAIALRYIGRGVQFDHEKYGSAVSMAPFTIFEKAVDGAPVAGSTFPLLLPHKDEAEARARAAGPIVPDKALLSAWMQRHARAKKAAAAAAAECNRTRAKL